MKFCYTCDTLNGCVCPPKNEPIEEVQKRVDGNRLHVSVREYKGRTHSSKSIYNRKPAGGILRSLTRNSG